VTAQNDLAFKSIEIEELSDVYFFRPLGWFVARAARRFSCTPTALTIVGMLIGIVGGAILYDERLGLVAFAILILHSIVDSADGQLARIIGRVSDFGRVLDGLSGYATHVAIYLAIGFGLVHRGARPSTFLWMLLAGMATAVHAGMYDYYRNAYTAVVTERRASEHRVPTVPPAIKPLVWLYSTIQRRLIESHARVEASLPVPVPDQELARYRNAFYPLVRGWNFLGDNTRFFAIGLLALLHRIDLFFPFVLVIMDVALVVLWFWQRSADRRFLASLASSKLPPE
jgi:CDP-alcohol phosphatidyltransferase